MTVLQPSEYDMSYFDGKLGSLQHNAGFSEYKRWYRYDGINSSGEFWTDKAAGWINHLALSGKKVLELGCAKGFIVEELRNAGVDAYGMDVSQYAISCASDVIKPYLYLGDVRTDLTRFSDREFDILISFRLMECIDDSEVDNLITSMSRIARKQVHIISVGSSLNQTYYNFKTLNTWLTYSWPRGTVLAPYNNELNYITK